jgi:hypothetical protein
MLTEKQPNEEQQNLERDIIRSEGEGFGVISQGYAAFRPTRHWSSRVTKSSNALDLEPGIFTWEDPRRIARSLLTSAEKSTRRKTAVINPPCRC